MSGGILQLIANGAQDKVIYDYRYSNLILRSECNQKVLNQALNMYSSYNALKICNERIKNDVNHPMWLPVEIYDIIQNMVKSDTENHKIHYLKSKVSLQELEVYKTDIDNKNNKIDVI